jgi:hypothetical protein
MDNHVKHRRVPIATAISAMLQSPEAAPDEPIGWTPSRGTDRVSGLYVTTPQRDSSKHARASTLRVVTIKKLVERPPYCDIFTESAFRNLINDAEDRFNSRGDRIPGNGLLECGAVFRVGRRVLVNLDALDEWLLSHCSKRKPDEPSIAIQT